tara:strand:+ start:75 stop:488 length:414 start_codon:yes stop_codon:yes gene_type:complete
MVESGLPLTIASCSLPGMIRVGFHTLLVLATVVGLLLPKMSAVVASLVPGVMVVTICTGSEMVTLTLNADGEPVEEVEPAVDHCVLADLIQDQPQPEAPWVALARSYRCPFVATPNPYQTCDYLRQQDPPRGPPALI